VYEKTELRVLKRINKDSITIEWRNIYAKIYFQYNNVEIHRRIKK
jgi:hypothetical protein